MTPDRALAAELAPELTSPRPPEARPATVFPLAATLAPVVFSVVVWAITGSAFALVFAALGPVVALASVVDGARNGRRHVRRERVRFESELDVALHSLVALQHQRRSELATLHPSVIGLAASGRDPDVWAMREPVGASIRVGSGAVESGIRLSPQVGASTDPRSAVALRSLADRARTLHDAPIVVDAREGVGFCGPVVPATAAARAMVMRLARVAEPLRWSVHGGRTIAWSWLGELPHPAAEAASREARGRGIVRATEEALGVVAIIFTPIDRDTASSAGEDAPLMVAIASTADDLPRWCRHVVALDLSGASLVYPRGSPSAGRIVVPDVATLEQAAGLARELRELAAREGRAGSSGLPASVDFSSLEHRGAVDAEKADAATLAAAIGSSSDGEYCLDLIRDGPHLVIGGTTGSGKSELLVTLVLALAARHPPRRVTFLLVDFKGGSAFDALAELPHRVGTITDLDAVVAQRALESLRAEIRHREEELARVGARSIDERGAQHTLARLVIAVDEFAALAEVLPELHGLFADLAARGRSLGIHLVLCTQRPAASVRDAILANCTLRICLRVNDGADSTALTGVSDAARLPRLPTGRALIGRAGERPRAIQVAISTRADAAAVAARWPAPVALRRPWCDPLPQMLPLDELPTPPPTPVDARVGRPGQIFTLIVFGLTDLPQRQRQEPAMWRPGPDGPLVVLGARGSGKSTALATVAALTATPTFLPQDVEGAWDMVAATLGALRGGSSWPPAPPGSVLLIDDLDAVLDRVDRDHELEFADSVSRLLREAPRRGLPVVVSLTSIPGPLQSAVSLCEARLLLRQASRHEHLLLGGASADYDPRLPPGGARWRGDRVQIGFTTVLPERSAAESPPLELPPSGVTAVVSTSTRRTLDRFRSLSASRRLRIVDLSRDGTARSADPALTIATAEEHVVIIGDPEAWQSAFGLHAAARGSARWVFDGCSVAEFRAVTRSRRLPPALAPEAGHAWLLDLDDRLSRVRLA